MIRDLVLQCRSYRRYHEDLPITHQMLVELVDLARLSASAANQQPLRYILSCEADLNARIFPHLRWAGYLKEWSGPEPGERPTAYVVMLGDNEVTGNVRWDDGIAAQTMLLAAVERGLGGCMIAALDRPALIEALRIPERYTVLMVVALGVPQETVVLEELEAGGDIRYWRDGKGIHHVPKRRLDDVIVSFD